MRAGDRVDPASVDALTFAARRSTPSRSPCCARSGRRGRVLPPVGGLPVLRLEGLADASGLLPAVAPTVAERLRVATGGNPLAMVEIASALSAEQVSGAAALPRELPVSDPEEVFAERLATLAPTRGRRRGCSPWPVRPRGQSWTPPSAPSRGAGRPRPSRPDRRRAGHHVAPSPGPLGGRARGAGTRSARPTRSWRRPGPTTRGGPTHPPGWHLAEAAEATDDEAAASWSPSRSGRRPSGPARTPPMPGSGRPS